MFAFTPIPHFFLAIEGIIQLYSMPVLSYSSLLLYILLLYQKNWVKLRVILSLTKTKFQSSSWVWYF